MRGWGFSAGLNNAVQSDDGTRVTYDLSDGGTYDSYRGEYYWSIQFSGLDNCDPAYTWSDGIIQMTYSDDEQNVLDVSRLDSPAIVGQDNGICREYGSRERASPGVA